MQTPDYTQDSNNTDSDSIGALLKNLDCINSVTKHQVIGPKPQF